MITFSLGASRRRPQPRRIGLSGYLELHRQRRALANLDEARLADLGLTRHEAEKEANRPIWDAPDNWTC